MTMGQVPHPPEPRSRVKRDVERPRLLPPARLESAPSRPPGATLPRITANDSPQHSPWLGGTACPRFRTCLRASVWDRAKLRTVALRASVGSRRAELHT